MAGETDKIVFEDLHGNFADREVDVNLDADDDDITYVDDDESSDEGDDGADDTSGDGADDKSDGEDGGSNDGDGDDDRFSKKFQRRLDRERRGKEAERSRADRAEAELTTLRKERKTEMEAQWDGEITSLADQEKELETSLEEAFENGNSKDQARLTSKLGSVQARKERFEAQKAAGWDDGSTEPPKGDGRPEVNPKAQGWADDHSDWFGQSGFERESRMARRMDKELLAEGYDPKENEFWEELTDRMKEAKPKLFEDLDGGDNDDDDSTGRSGKGNRSPVAPTTGEGKTNNQSNKQGGQKRVRITAQDKENMRKFGLDPDDPATLKEYAQNKRQLAEPVE